MAERVAATLYKTDSAVRAMGIEIVAVSPGGATLTMTIRADMLNSQGIAHGGYTFALADTAMAYAACSRNRLCIGQTLSINYTSPGREGEILTAIAEERHLTKRTGIYDTTVTGSDGRTVAVVRGVARVSEDRVIEAEQQDATI